jgi:hypothetical protein
MREREQSEVEVLSIGPAGENLVRFAGAVHSRDKSRDGVAGRGGLGAVIGAKRRKAVAATDNRKTTVAYPDAIKTLLNDIREPMQVGTAGLQHWGSIKDLQTTRCTCAPCCLLDVSFSACVCSTSACLAHRISTPGGILCLSHFLVWIRILKRLSCGLISTVISLLRCAPS